MRLQPFSGDIRDYKRFMQIFHVMVHDNPDLADVAKLTYLLQYLEGPALRTACAYDVTGENYRPVLDILKKRYGRYELLIQEEAHRVVSHPRVQEGNWKKLREFLDVTKATINSLLTYDPHSMDHPWLLYSEILYKMPDKVLIDWNTFYGSQNQETLRQDPGRLIDVLTEWLERYLASRESIYVRDMGRKSLPTNLVQDTSKGNNGKPGAKGSLYSFYAQGGTTACIFCGRTNHKAAKCMVAKDPKAAYQTVKQSKACVRCLEESHEKPACNSQEVCGKCGKDHHTILHFKEEKATGTKPKTPAASHFTETQSRAD